MYCTSWHHLCNYLFIMLNLMSEGLEDLPFRNLKIPPADFYR